MNLIFYGEGFYVIKNGVIEVIDKDCIYMYKEGNNIHITNIAKYNYVKESSINLEAYKNKIGRVSIFNEVKIDFHDDELLFDNFSIYANDDSVFNTFFCIMIKIKVLSIWNKSSQDISFANCNTNSLSVAQFSNGKIILKNINSNEKFIHESQLDKIKISMCSLNKVFKNTA